MMKSRVVIFSLLIIIAVFCWVYRKPIFVEYLIWNSDARERHFAKKLDDCHILSALIVRAKKIPGEKGYDMLSEIYLCIAKKSEDELSCVYKIDESLVRTAFGGYTNMHHGNESYEEEKKRYENIVLRIGRK